MAYYTDTQHRAAGTMERAMNAVSNLLSNVAVSLSWHRIARTTYTELSNLTDRDLADLGFTRSDLRRVAREAAQGKL